MKKYEFTDETKVLPHGIKLHRIRATRDFGNVKTGDLGGWIETTNNLSHFGCCWVADEAIVMNCSQIFEDALVYGNAIISNNAQVRDSSQVYNNAEVSRNAKVRCNAKVFNNARILENAIITGNAQIFGDSIVSNNAIVSDFASIYGQARIYENAQIWGNAQIYGNIHIYRNAKVHDEAIICKSTEISGDAEICGNARIESNEDYIVFKNFWSSGRYFTWTRSNNMWKVGCFHGTGEELIKKAYADSEESGREYERVVKYVESIINNK